MAKKNKPLIPASLVKVVFLLLVVILGCSLLWRGTIWALTNWDFFKVKTVRLDRSVTFLDKRDLSWLIGKSILTVDLGYVQRRLEQKYPQISELQIKRHFPNEIFVEAHRRLPIAQVIWQNKGIIVDENAVVLAVAKIGQGLPLIQLPRIKQQKIFLGAPIYDRELAFAITTIKAYRQRKYLANLKIVKIDVESLSKIQFSLSNNLDIIIDWDKIEDKMNTLEMLLTHGGLKVDEVKYIDLRFQEPIIGKR